MVSIPWPSTLRHNETPVQATSSISALDPLLLFILFLQTTSSTLEKMPEVPH